MTTTIAPKMMNGLDVDFLLAAVNAVAQNPDNGQTHWEVSSQWKGGARSDTSVKECIIGGKRVAKDYSISIDEPLELGGTNQFANPQEYLLAAVNACMIVTYAAYCALEGIELEELRIDTDGDIDLRGLFSLDPSVKAGYDSLRYKVFIKGAGKPEQFEKVHQTVKSASPNYFNMASAISMNAELVIGE